MICSHNNWSYFGYRGGCLNDKVVGDTLEWTFSQCTQPPGSFKDECVRAAALVARKADGLGRKPVILLSGGLDSEAMVRAFMDSGVQFSTASFTYTDGMLAHETTFIDRFVEKHRLQHRYVERDWIGWLHKPAAKQMFMESGSVFSACVPHIELMRIIWEEGGFPVVGTGDVSLELRDGDWHFVNRENLRTPLIRYLHRKGMDGVVLFYQFTPEQTASFMLEPEITQAVASPIARKVLRSLTYLKYGIYRRYWPDLELRVKHTQDERHTQLYQQFDIPWANERDVRYTDIFSVPYSNLISQLLS